MEQQIAQCFLWSVYINATTLLVIVAALGYVLIQIRRDTRDITRTIDIIGNMAFVALTHAISMAENYFR